MDVSKRLTALTNKLPSKTSSVETEVDRVIALELMNRRCICLPSGLETILNLLLTQLDHAMDATRASCSARIQ
jgi:hypothetical protein